ncbi:Wd and tetratricopeptide repeat protein [Neofusicoccum parvum]|uniref:Wd and tetratricopeptide repeat protein n=1 Tax=Neofusicoccum parvum TaxID=310453 RepID=A0ACB5SKE2_9PEZI|nr:Wd and tetratricopeptide repeat protein [Neofusicoccum parvum]
MARPLYSKLLNRELGLRDNKYARVHDIYGDRRWVRDLDIVNELSGHSGCVNALCWSKSGQLLASGSDDQHVNIHTYLPQSSSNQFDFSTTISTGHRANIFSVKFMPYTNDHTIVTAAGDAEVRIFDIEYAGSSAAPANTPGRSNGLNTVYDGVRYVSDNSSNCKVFRSHSDRVKRIVTESSPWLFLTCSEDGEVRQWDIRQPESQYPAPSSMSRRVASDDNVPPPLISYKRYHLDLNTISCSPSQPHYIALGGAHLHCFLHDRRMTGRDRLRERGAPLSSPDKLSEHDDELMRQATQCVRKFAPNGQKRMKRTDNGHITACKISDHNPNEMIVSWSGEWIYSFDLVHSPDVTEQENEDNPRPSKGNSRAKESKTRKRKRARTGLSQESAERGGSRPRTGDGSPEEDEEMSLMVHYENGQREEIPIEPPRARSPISEAREAVLPEAQRQSFRIAKNVVSMRKNLFTLGVRKEPSDSDPTGYAVPFTSVLGYAATVLPQMDEVSRGWRYPVNPLNVDVAFQNNLREKRGSARRFVQAAGTLARVLGGRLRTAGGGSSPALSYFEKIVSAPRESHEIPRHEQFGYDFLKAILLWLDSGVGALLEGFTRPRDISRGNPRYPVPADAGSDAIDEVLIPYLLQLADETPIINIDASPFETDQNRVVFPTGKAAVVAFAQALKIPFEDLSSAVVPASPSLGGGSTAPEALGAQDRKAALRFWGFKVGRGLLMNSSQDVNFAFVDRAFGGLGRGDASVRQDEASIHRALRNIDPDEEEDPVESARLVRRPRATGNNNNTSEGSDENESMDSDEEAVPADELREIIAGRSDDDEEDDDYEDDAGDSAEESEEDDEDDDDDDEPTSILFRSAFERTRLKEKVELDKPCSPHIRKYRGHCNVKTVKDVNFFGLEDEYIVSGSDSGHLFIWDKKTTQIVNILEGDGEVVNVVQGHPYEPMLAVSGIDHTVKVFSPDARARRNARLGIGVTPGDTSQFSSISFGPRLRRRQQRAPSSADDEVDTTTVPEGDENEDERAPPNGLPSRRRMHDEYRITSENDVNRAGGSRESFITTRRLWKINAMFVLWAGGRLPFQLPDGNIGFTQPLHTLLGMERDRLHIDPDVVQLFSRIFGLDGRLGSLFGGN